MNASSRRRIAAPIKETFVTSAGENVSAYFWCQRFAATLPIYLTARFFKLICNPWWRNPNHFADCSNFEQSLLKMMTRLER
jgi:hypothetical protein